MKRIYLAGPDVFLPDAREHGEKLKAIANEFGFDGLFPLDNEIEGDNPAELAEKIRVANIEMIKSCDAVVANLSTFRGAEPDSGTVWEVGFAQGLGKLVVGYCADDRTLKDKAIDILGLSVGATKDQAGMEIEDFGLTHNLMFADVVTCRSFEDAMYKLKSIFNT